MEITVKLKKRFVSDIGSKVNIFDEPYFSERLKVFGEYEEWLQFVDLVERLGGEEQFNQELFRIKDNLIDTIKTSSTYNYLQEMNFDFSDNKYGDVDVYNMNYDGKLLMSIDLRQGNNQAYYHLSQEKGLDYNYKRFQDLVKKFTNEPYFINSRFIRQVVFGNTNPKRIGNYEKQLMLTYIVPRLEELGLNIVSLKNDEVIVELDKADESLLTDPKLNQLDVHINIYKLHRLLGTHSGFYREMIYSNENIKRDFKGVSAFEMLFVIKKLNNVQVSENDYIIHTEYGLARLLNIPNVEVE